MGSGVSVVASSRMCKTYGLIAISPGIISCRIDIFVNGMKLSVKELFAVSVGCDEGQVVVLSALSLREKPSHCFVRRDKTTEEKTIKRT